MLAGNRYDVNFLCEDVYTYDSGLGHIFFKLWLILLVIKVEQIYLKGMLWARCDEGVKFAFVIVLRGKGNVTVFEPVVYIFHCNMGHARWEVFWVFLNSLVSLGNGALKPFVDFLDDIIFRGWHKLYK
jgi:hypothetical protein